MEKKALNDQRPIVSKYWIGFGSFIVFIVSLQYWISIYECPSSSVAWLSLLIDGVLCIRYTRSFPALENMFEIKKWRRKIKGKRYGWIYRKWLRFSACMQTDSFIRKKLTIMLYQTPYLVAFMDRHVLWPVRWTKETSDRTVVLN